MSSKRRRRSSGQDGKRWVARVKKGVPPGLEGQPDIRPGDELQVLQVVEWAALGKVAFPVPQPSILLLNAGRARIARAVRIKTGLPGQTSTKGAIPGVDRTFTNTEAVFDFFSEAMGGIVLCHAALDSYANESIPEEFEMEIEGRLQSAKQLEQRGIERRLSSVLSMALSKPNLMTDEPATWDRVMGLKQLRDDISHVRGPILYSTAQPQATIWARLLNEELEQFPETVEAVMGHYGKAPRRLGSTSANIGGGAADEGTDPK